MRACVCVCDGARSYTARQVVKVVASLGKIVMKGGASACHMVVAAALWSLWLLAHPLVVVSTVLLFLCRLTTAHVHTRVLAAAYPPQRVALFTAGSGFKKRFEGFTEAVEFLQAVGFQPDGQHLVLTEAAAVRTLPMPRTPQAPQTSPTHNTLTCALWRWTHHNNSGGLRGKRLKMPSTPRWRGEMCVAGVGHLWMARVHAVMHQTACRLSC